MALTPSHELDNHKEITDPQERKQEREKRKEVRQALAPMITEPMMTAPQKTLKAQIEKSLKDTMYKLDPTDAAYIQATGETISHLLEKAKGKDKEIDTAELLRIHAHLGELDGLLDNNKNYPEYKNIKELREALQWVVNYVTPYGSSHSAQRPQHLKTIADTIQAGDPRNFAGMMLAFMDHGDRVELVKMLSKDKVVLLSKKGYIGRSEVEDANLGFKEGTLQLIAANKKYIDTKILSAAKGMTKEGLPYGSTSYAGEVLTLKNLGRGILYAYGGLTVAMNIISCWPNIKNGEIDELMKNPYFYVGAAEIYTAHQWGSDESIRHKWSSPKTKEQWLKHESGKDLVHIMDNSPEGWTKFMSAQNVPVFGEFVHQYLVNKDGKIDPKKVTLEEFEKFLASKPKYATAQKEFAIAKNDTQMVTQANLIKMVMIFKLWNIGAAPNMANQNFQAAIKEAKTSHDV